MGTRAFSSSNQLRGCLLARNSGHIGALTWPSSGRTMDLMLRPGPALAVVCSLWLPVCSSDQLFANTTAISRQDDGSSRRQAPAHDASDEKDADASRPTAAAAERRLDSRPLTLGGFFVGYVDLPASRPLPNTTPSHEEMKAATTPPEFRTPPAVSFGWSWKGRR